ncbi:MAG: hypothetical protein WA584_07470 [Pyrinomonadaceae bacterium]
MSQRPVGNANYQPGFFWLDRPEYEGFIPVRLFSKKTPASLHVQVGFGVF